LLVDISELIRRDAGTGIQRVVKQILRCWFASPPAGRQICLVYSDPGEPGYRHATRFTLNWFQLGLGLLPDAPVTYRADDIFIGLDLQPEVASANAAVYRQMRGQGVQVLFVVYDLIAVLHPQYFEPGAQDMFTRWLHVIAQSDGIVSISQAVKDQLATWLQANEPQQGQSPALSWFHLGADPTPETAADTAQASLPPALASFDLPTFLMVGTIEPRKGHEQALVAFERLWQQGCDYRLVIVGKQGWLVDECAEALLQHPEWGKRLFWLDSASDVQLHWLYQKSHGLLACSWAEGFGLPLIEAARYGLPLLVRDIAVFREVAGDNAWYFSANSGDELAQSIRKWVSLYQKGDHPTVNDLQWLSWADSARALSYCIGLGAPGAGASALAKRPELNCS
jgi:glycosyltransferase involved in cell wall biosynthesis